jgi:hypothetical protein
MQFSAAVQRSALSAFVAAGTVLGSSVAQAVDHPVLWTNQVNVADRGGVLQKIDGCQGCDDAGAISRQIIRSGNGYAEFSVDSPNAFWLAGLSRQGSTIRFNDIDFALRFNGNGHATFSSTAPINPMTRRTRRAMSSESRSSTVACSMSRMAR